MNQISQTELFSWNRQNVSVGLKIVTLYKDKVKVMLYKDYLNVNEIGLIIEDFLHLTSFLVNSIRIEALLLCKAQKRVAITKQNFENQNEINP